MFLWSLLACLIVVFDQLSKFLIIEYVGNPNKIINFIPHVIEFSYVENNGAAFNILSGKIQLLSVISIIFACGVIYYMISKKPKNKLLRISMMLLFAGAIGNAIDRIFRGYVIDFIKTLFINFPVFNIADISITCGAVLLIIYILFFDNKKE